VSSVAGGAHVPAVARSLAWAGERPSRLADYTFKSSKQQFRAAGIVSTRRVNRCLQGTGWSGGYDVVSTPAETAVCVCGGGGGAASQ